MILVIINDKISMFVNYILMQYETKYFKNYRK